MIAAYPDARFFERFPVRPERMVLCGSKARPRFVYPSGGGLPAVRYPPPTTSENSSSRNTVMGGASSGLMPGV